MYTTFKTEYFIYCNAITWWWNTWILNISKGNRQDDMIVSLSIYHQTTIVLLHLYNYDCSIVLSICIALTHFLSNCNLIKQITEKCFLKFLKTFPTLMPKDYNLQHKFCACCIISVHFFHIILVGGFLVHQNIYLCWTRCSFPLGRTGQVIYLARRNHV